MGQTFQHYGIAEWEIYKLNSRIPICMYMYTTCSLYKWPERAMFILQLILSLDVQDVWTYIVTVQHVQHPQGFSFLFIVKQLNTLFIAKQDAFERRRWRVQAKMQARSNENAGAFASQVKRVRTRTFPRSNESLHAVERQPSRIRTRTYRRSNEDLHTIERGPSRIRMRTLTSLTYSWTSSFDMWNTFVL